MKNRRVEIKLTKKEIIPLVLLFIILILIAIIVYKSIIISIMIGKAKTYENYINAYQQIAIEDNGKLQIYQIYKKGDNIKVITLQNNKKVMQYSNNNVVKTYTDDGRNKTLNTYIGEGTYNSITVNYIRSETIWEIINDAIISNIKAVELDGIDCYVISGLPDGNVSDENIKSVKLYIEKQTGIPVQKIEERNDGSKITTTYTYKFDAVSNKDMIEPGAAEYRSK